MKHEVKILLARSKITKMIFRKELKITKIGTSKVKMILKLQRDASITRILK